MPITSEHIKKIVSFEVYPSAILGSDFSMVQVLAILDYESLYGIGIDPVSMHANVYPSLPPGTPNDYRQYSYVKIKLQDGSITALGLPWINDSTIAVHVNTQMRVTISGINAGTDVAKVRNALIQNGFNQIAVELL
jgi:hypothetical protein